MQEVLPGIFHWSTPHPKINVEVSSYWLDDGGVLIDPLIPRDVGLRWFESRPSPPHAITLSSRHHYRDSSRLAQHFGCRVLCNRAGLHEFTHGEPVTGFDPGERLAGDLIAFEIGGLCPDETALHSAPARTLWLADAFVRNPSEEHSDVLGFVPDTLMDDPPETKRQLLAALTRALDELDFENVMLAHGGPLVGDGRRQLQEFVDSGGRTAFEY